jgi:putative ABC transport system permease protein
MATLLQDIRYGARLLSRNVGFTLVAALTLSLGIGADSAIFSIVKGVLTPPYPEGDHLVRIISTDPQHGFSNINVSYPDFADWSKSNRCFESMSLFGGANMNLTGAGEPESLRGIVTSADFFGVLKCAPAHGRTYTVEEEKSGGERVAVISYGLWQRRFAGDHSLIGKTILLDGTPHTVIGIMPADFVFPDARTELWLPHRIDLLKAKRDARGYSVVARLKPGVTLPSARANMDAIASGLARDYPGTNEGIGAAVIDLSSWSNGPDAMLMMTIVYLAVTFVLLIACANVANLLLARATSRMNEIAIRMSLGGGRARLLRQLLTESALLALIGGAGGVIVAYWCLKAILAIGPADMPNRDHITMNMVALTYTTGLSLLCGFIFGITPALHATGRRITAALGGSRQASAGPGRHRLLNAFVVAEISMAVVLLVCGILMARSFIAQISVNPGFDTRNLLTARLILPEYKYGRPPLQTAFMQEVLARAKTVPGIRAIGAVQSLPLDFSSWENTFSIEGRAPSLPGKAPSAGMLIVASDYFRTMGIKLILGRFFSEEDSQTQPAAIINQTLARRYFLEDANPLGRRIALGTEAAPKWLPIVGVVSDVHHRDLGEPPRPEIFIPYRQQPTRRMTVVARTEGDPHSYATAIRSAVWSIDPNQPVSMIRTMEEVVTDRVSDVRALAQVMGTLAFMALVLAAVGIYGVVSYAVGERTREIGIRVAFGAQKSHVCTLILRRGLFQMAAGLVIGTAGALASTRYLQSHLYGVTSSDPVSYLATAVGLLAVGLLAMFWPVRRALAVDPLTALRQE